MPAKITVLLVDDHALVRRGFRRMLEDDPAISVVAEASDGPEAVRLALQLRPRVIEAAPWVAAPEYSSTLDRYVRTLATTSLGLEFIAQVATEKGCSFPWLAPRRSDTCGTTLAIRV